MENKKNNLIKASLFGLLGVVIYSLLILTIFVSEYRNVRDNLTTTQNIELEGTVDSIISLFNVPINQIEVLSDSALAIDAFKREESKELIENYFYKLAMENDIYAQLRLLDKDGNEIVRVNKKDNQVEIVDDYLLQNKKDRYYFKDLMNHPEEFYLSDLDLNVEKGEIEVPYVPTIRMGKAVYDGDKLIGSILFNIDGTNIINHFEELAIHEHDEYLWVDAFGDYIYNMDESKVFRRMFGEEGLFVSEYNEYFSMFDDLEKDVIAEVGQAYIVKFEFLEIEHEEKHNHLYYFVMIENDDVIWEKLSNVISYLVYASLLLIPSIFTLIFLFAKQSYEKRMLNEENRKQALIDPLTGLHNRRFIYEYLLKLIPMALREHYPLTIAFIDINDLKEINDHFGHEMGDLMIKSVSKTLLNHVRKSDLIARVGGDELIAIFPKCTKEAAKTILYRSHTDLEELGLDACGVKWSFSSGCVEYQKDESVDDVIKRADAKMYKEKERYRLTKKKNIDLNNLKLKDK